MPKPSHREKLLTEGLRVVHAHGFAGAGVRDIVRAAGVPQGSFTNHFASKEAFGLEIIDLYYAGSREVMRTTLRNDALPPLERLGRWIEANRDRAGARGMRNGCLLGNFAAEASDHSEAIRRKVVGIFGELQQAVASCLHAAVAVGEVAPGTDCDEIAAFIVSSMQGAILLAKAERSAAPIERFRHLLFTRILSLGATGAEGAPPPAQTGP
jgi:TetR/AcrR family transcriptional repressor of nem operon